MSIDPTGDPARAAKRRDSAFCAVGAGIAALAFLMMNAIGGFPTLFAADGDNDSLMRLVQVRDLIAGQNWFDLFQYRMGLEGGFEMHWSRLVDAPIAGLVLAASGLFGSAAAGETVAAVLWPVLLYAAALFFLLRAAILFGGSLARFPALVVGALTLHAVGMFRPGSLDHHNVQLVLTLGLVGFLMADPHDRRAAAAAGACAALMLAVGMETAPYVAIACAYVSVLYLHRGKEEAPRAASFGLAFGSVALCAFLLTVGRPAWATVRCDAFSIAQLVVAAGGGYGLYAATRIAAASRSARVRLLLLLALAVAIAAVLATGFPQCLRQPYADLDPHLRDYWMNAIEEAQSVRSVFLNDPTIFAGYYVTPLLALVVVGLRLRTRGFNRRDAVPELFLLGAIAVSCWQIRGAMFALPLAVIPLAAWIGGWRTSAGSGPRAQLRLALVWLVSFNLVWSASAEAAQVAFGKVRADKEETEASECYRWTDYEELAALPAGTVAAASNLGASILALTPHRVLSGPYHRNIEGNLAALDIFLKSPEKAKEVIGALNVDLVAVCAGNPETQALAEWAPEGLMAGLLGETGPNWLEPLAGPAEAPLRLYRVRLD